jgi:excisionase family DNA binding protein
MTSKKKRNEINNDAEDFDWLTVAEACEVLKCSKRKIQELRKDGRLEVVKFDHANRVTKRSLNRLLSQIFSGETS